MLRLPLFVALSAMCLLTGARALAAEFSSKHGFSFKHPDDWVVASKEQQEAVAAEVRARFSQVRDLDLDRVAAFILDTSGGDFANNVNIIVTAESLEMNADSVTKVSQAIQNEMGKAGLSPSGLSSKLARFGANQAIVSDWTVDLPGIQAVRQRQVVYSGKHQSYIVTCSASADGFTDAEPKFTAILDSFRFDPGADTAGGGFLSRLPPILRYALIGAVVGGVIGGLGAIFKKRQSPPPSTPTYGAPPPA
jgi:hypothetical protein